MNENKLELVQQIASIGYFEWDLFTGHFFCSDQIYRNIDLTPLSTPSLNWFLNTIHPEDLDLVRTKIMQSPAAEVSHAEYRSIKPDGSVVWLHLRVCSLADQNGTMYKKFGTIQDITNKKILELNLHELTECLNQINSSLRSSQQNYVMAQGIAKLGYFEWDIIKQKIFWSKQQYINLGYTPQKDVPSVALFLKRLHPDDIKIVKTVSRNIPAGKYAEIEFRIIRADESVGWLYARATAITNSQGHPTMLLGITQDITEKKLAEARIKKSEKELLFIKQLNTRSGYLNRLLINDYPLEYSSKALSEFGIESHTNYCCFVIHISDKTGPSGDTGNASALLHQVLIWLADKGYDKFWTFQNNIILLMPIIDEDLINNQSQIAFSSNLYHAIKKQCPYLSIKIGISGISEIPFSIKELYEKALRAAIVATANNPSSIIHFDDIGLYDVAFQLLKDKNIAALANSSIGRLVEYDQTRSGNLLLTLKCILDGESLKAVAKKLYIHPNTAIWRKHRIEELLGVSLDNMEAKVTLMLHLKIWELLHISEHKAD